MGQNSKIWGVKKIQQRFLEAELLDSKPRQMPPGCHTLPRKWYHHIAWVPAHLKPPEHFGAPSLLHRVNIDFPKTPLFGQSTRTVLESPKIDICQKGPHGALGHVSSCLETKFDKEMSMGSVPNCPKKIANRYGIRWFKCKLKPPKNVC